MRMRRLASRQSWLFYCASFFVWAAIARGEEIERATPQKVVIEVKVVEVNLTKLRSLGFDWAQIKSDSVNKHTIDGLIEAVNKKSASAEEFASFLEALRQNNLARVIAEPTIVTLDGRPASFAIGSTQLDAVPVVVGSGRVRLECRIEVAPENEAARPAGKAEADRKSPLIRVDAATELELGRTAIVGHARTRPRGTDSKTSEIETLVLARVDLLKPGQLSKTASPPGEFVDRAQKR